MSQFACVSAERANHAVSTLCRVVGVSVSGFYAGRQAIPRHQRRATADADLRGHIGRIFTARRRVYGAPGSMPNCAGKGGGMHAGALRG